MEVEIAGARPRRRRRREPVPRSWEHPSLRVVAIGGGTGLPAVLGGLARFARRGVAGTRVEVTAIVAASDEGGSSGRLRRENGVLPPGDVRNCLIALADERNRSLARLFRYRFGEGRGLRGHSLGNLLLTALTSLEGDFLGAIGRAERMLRCQGRVLPATLEPVRLVGLLEDGGRIEGEQNFVSERASRIARIELSPRAPAPAPGVLDAIRAADVIVLGPGSLYSSVITNLMVDGVADSIRESRALRILVQNLMTEPGETVGLDAVAHVEAVLRHGGKVADVLLVDGRPKVANELLRGYAQKGQHPVPLDSRAVLARGLVPVEADLIAAGARVRHDPDKLAAAVIGLALQASEA